MFNVWGRTKSYTWVDDKTAVAVMSCAACSQGTVVIERGTWDSAPGNRQFDAESPLHWWPTPGAAGTLPPDLGLPTSVVDSYDEGVRCLSVRATHGAVCNFRTALAQIANDKGDEVVRKERHLANKLALLRKSSPLLEAMGDYTEAITAIGNAAAHQEDYQPVSMAQADDARALTKFLIFMLYEVPAQARRMLPERRRGN